MNTWTTIYDTATIQPEPPTAEQAEEALDFEALKDSCRHLSERVPHILWLPEEVGAYCCIRTHLPQLIAMAERCEKAEEKLHAISMAVMGRDCEDIVAIVFDVLAERMKYQRERNAAVEELEAQPSGLSEDEQQAIDAAKRNPGDITRRLLAIIDRLSRQKTLTWRKGGESHFSGGPVMYVSVKGELKLRECGNWKWARQTRWLYVSDLLATLPKEK